MNERRPYSTKNNGQEVQPPGQQRALASDLLKYLHQYTRERPDVAALMCLGIGFVLGWKLRPW